MKLLRAFGFAFQGVASLLKTQWNARIHLLATIVVFLLAGWLRVSRAEWLILVLICTLVMAMEAVNTAIESVVDLSSPEVHPLAKQAKDVGAAAVLIAAIGAVVIGLTIFVPHLRQRFSL